MVTEDVNSTPEAQANGTETTSPSKNNNGKGWIVALITILVILLIGCILITALFGSAIGIATLWPSAEKPVVEVPVVEEQHVVDYVPVPSDWCYAEVIGTPVQEDGMCSYCTINYEYDPDGINPGDVYVVFGEAMEYFAATEERGGAYVYQYKPNRFPECISGQPMMKDPGYNIIFVYPKD